MLGWRVSRVSAVVMRSFLIVVERECYCLYIVLRGKDDYRHSLERRHHRGTLKIAVVVRYDKQPVVLKAARK